MGDRLTAVRDLVLDPRGVLHREPETLLFDDLRDVAQSSSILQLVGMGCRRLSEIAGRLEKPATSLARPVRRLVDLALVRQAHPFGVSPRDSKRTLYRLADPFLGFWFRFVSSNRSRLEARAIAAVERDVERGFAAWAGSVWEELARACVPGSALFGVEWGPASPWWGPGLDRRSLEVDLVAESVDGKKLLLGEVKWEEATDLARVEAELSAAEDRLPFVGGRRVYRGIWLKRPPRRQRGAVSLVDPGQVLDILR